ncbi:hypothetical protein L596_026144 [Steinernema carpocapsae]|uniref:Uncharacterized protein n=1 Tax=Steinernema carpocapsae TaxID=34508 RepID=A0A4U5M0J4_STECR|nr:hypothetical protein L596_026144 [Steinernema carpocapsae]
MEAVPYAFAKAVFAQGPAKRPYHLFPCESNFLGTFPALHSRVWSDPTLSSVRISKKPMRSVSVYPGSHPGCYLYAVHYDERATRIECVTFMDALSLQKLKEVKETSDLSDLFKKLILPGGPEIVNFSIASNNHFLAAVLQEFAVNSYALQELVFQDLPPELSEESYYWLSEFYRMHLRRKTVTEFISNVSEALFNDYFCPNLLTQKQLKVLGCDSYKIDKAIIEIIVEKWAKEPRYFHFMCSAGITETDLFKIGFKNLRLGMYVKHHVNVQSMLTCNVDWQSGHFGIDSSFW